MNFIHNIILNLCTKKMCISRYTYNRIVLIANSQEFLKWNTIIIIKAIYIWSDKFAYTKTCERKGLQVPILHVEFISHRVCVLEWPSLIPKHRTATVDGGSWVQNVNPCR